VIAPAAIVPQWHRAARSKGISICTTSLESLSRRGFVPETDLLIVDEAHRFRNPRTRRYDRLARGVRRAHVLLVTATPVVNRAADIIHLLRLFLPDNALAVLGADSLESFLTTRLYDDLLAVIAPLVVARSTRAVPQVATRIPRPCDGSIFRRPPVREGVLDRLLSTMDTLTFPGFEQGAAAALMRRHLCYRLASSARAFQDTVRRHLRYADRALAAGARGKALSRSETRRLFDPDGDLQLELDGLFQPAMGVPLDPTELRAERMRLTRLLDESAASAVRNPKGAQLADLLRARGPRKTIVFTSAVATALDLAKVLGWRRVAVAAGGRAWIASGRLALEEALAMFAPRARGVAGPPSSARVDALLATDFASEGLDLQDADGVVHFDLPWTSLRLAQRLGRVARLGSTHRTVRVWWFAPPRSLARRMGLEVRIDEKVRTQLALGVPSTSRVGRARVSNVLDEWRAALAAEPTPHGLERVGHSVVEGRDIAAFALRWSVGPALVPELIVFRGEPPQRVRDARAAWRTTQAVADMKEDPASPPTESLQALRTLVRDRLGASDRGPRNSETRRLARRVLLRARPGRRRRALGELALLDAVLNRLEQGLSVGAERELGAVLERPTQARLRAWLTQHPAPARLDLVNCSLDASLFGIRAS
jgi:hypothetical protein